MIRRPQAVAALVCMAAAAGAFWKWTRSGPPGSGGVQGLDLSHHQPAADWGNLRTVGIRFAYLKATEGADWRDSLYRTHEEGARAQGIVVGAYHFFTFCADPESQASHFLANMDLRPGDLIPAVDVEEAGNCKDVPGPEALRKSLGTFLARLEASIGTVPVVYMTQGFHRKNIRAVPAGAPLWIRNYVWKPFEEPSWSIWQYATNRPPGSAFRIDRNVLRDGEATLAALRYRPAQAGQSGATAAMGGSAP